MRDTSKGLGVNSLCLTMSSMKGAPLSSSCSISPVSPLAATSRTSSPGLQGTRASLMVTCHVSRGSSGHGVVTADHWSLHIARCAPRHGRDSTELPNSASACAVLHRTVLYYTPLLRAAQWHCCEENQLPIFHSLAILVLWSFLYKYKNSIRRYY